MSISGPQSGIRFSGISSGIDVESIVTQLISLEQFPIQRLQAQQAQLQARQTIYGQFKSTLQSLNSAASSLNFSSAFQVNKSAATDDTVATGTSTDAAVPGTYSLNVLAIAKSHKLTSASQSSTTSELGMAGDFLVNGKKVSILASDTLTSIASKINGLGASVSANVVNGGTDQAYLVLGSTKTGAANEILITDVSGGVAQGLGLVTGTQTLRSLSGSVASSSGFKNSTDTISSLTGAAISGNLTLGTDDIAFDSSTDTLQTLADKINATGNHTASLATEKVDGVDVVRLKIDSASWPSTYSDPSNLLGVLGVTKNGIANQVTGASDAQVQIDGITINSATNTLSNVVGGMTFTLKKVGTSDINVTRDTTAIKEKVKKFQEAYNSVVSYIRDNSKLDGETFQAGPLFGDQTVSQVEGTLSTLLFNSLGTGSLKSLSDIGFGLDDQGKLELDESKLDNAVNNKIDDLKSLLMATGRSANSELKYVSSGNKSVASSSSGFNVNISQVATKASVTALNAFSSPHSGGETLTFGGSPFGSGSVNLTVSAGMTLGGLIDLINNDSRLKDIVVASDEGGSLKITNKRFGTAGNFTVTSNLAEGADNSGIGTSGGTNVAGLNVEGTINGEPATGNGQFLLGNSGNSKTDGLQIQYTGTSTGDIGSLIFNRGVAAMTQYRVNSFTDSVNGLMTTVDKTLTDQVQDIEDRITSLSTLISLKEESLRRRFTAMEAAMSRATAQGSQLSAMLSGLG